jgi:twitching motility protein PilI
MATKVSLRQFQQDLSQRLSSAKTEAVSTARLGVQCGVANWLIALDDAGEVMPLPEVLAVPLTRPWFAGVANIRGGLYSVVDFSAFTGGEPTVRGADCRLVLAGPRFGINAGLMVTRMQGLRNARDLDALAEGADVPGENIATAKSGAASAAPWAGRAWRERGVSGAGAAAGGRVWRELKFEHLIEAADFLNVGV